MCVHTQSAAVNFSSHTAAVQNGGSGIETLLLSGKGFELDFGPFPPLSFFIGAQIGAYDVVLVNMVPAPAMNEPGLLTEAMNQAKVNISRTVVHEIKQKKIKSIESRHTYFHRPLHELNPPHTVILCSLKRRRKNEGIVQNA